METRKQWISAQEVVAEYGRTIDYWKKLAREGKVVAKQNGKWLFERVSIEAYMRGEPATEPEAKEPDEVTELDAELTRLEKADKAEDLKIAIAAKHLKFKTPEDYAQALQDVEDERVTLGKFRGQLQGKEAELEEREVVVNTFKSNKAELRAELESWREAILHDFEYLRELFNRRFPYDSSKDWANPAIFDLKLSESIYKGSEPVEMEFEHEGFLGESESESEFDEGEDDEE